MEEKKENIKIEPLIISEDEINKISKIASDRKMDFPKSKLYEKDNITILENFCDSYTFLSVLANNIKVSNKEIYEKINKYFINFNDLYVDCRLFLNKSKISINFGSARRKQKLDLFVLKKIKIIQDFINTVFPIGKRVTLYDPDEAAGIA